MVGPGKKNAATKQPETLSADQQIGVRMVASLLYLNQRPFDTGLKKRAVGILSCQWCKSERFAIIV